VFASEDVVLGSGGGCVGGGQGVVHIIGRALDDGFQPGAGLNIAGGGVGRVAVGADDEGVGAGGERGAESGEHVALENVAGHAGEAGGEAEIGVAGGVVLGLV